MIANYMKKYPVTLPAARALRMAWKSGFVAAMNGQAKNACPFSFERKNLREAWREGWEEFNREEASATEELHERN